MADDNAATDAPAPTTDDDGPILPDDSSEQAEAKETAEPKESPKEEPKAEETKEPEAKPDKPSETPAEEPKEEKPEEPKAEPDEQLSNHEAAQRRIAERQRLKTQAQAQLRQTYQPQTAEQLEQQGLDTRDAEIEALRQRVEVSEFSNNVADLTANMNMDAQQVEQEFDIFSEKSPNFDKDFAEKVSKEYIRDAQVQFDDTGQYVMSARIPMYDYYKSRYEDRMAGVKRGAIQGQKASEKMLAAAETPSSAPPADEGKKDPFEDAFDKEWGN